MARCRNAVRAAQADVHLDEHKKPLTARGAAGWRTIGRRRPIASVRRGALDELRGMG